MKKLYPVVHVDNLEQAKENVKVAFDAGTDGVFLINHSISSETLLRIHKEIHDLYKDDPSAQGVDRFDIGINCLDLSAWEMANIVDETIPMFWTDNAEIDEGANRQMKAGMNRVTSGNRSPTSKYFGGVAFKYQKPVKNLEEITKEAWAYMDVICTSGAATGVAAPLEKLNTMRKALNMMNSTSPHRTVLLAIASGITIDNVLDYKDSVDIFLVSTGISKDFLTLDSDKVKELADKIHSM